MIKIVMRYKISFRRGRQVGEQTNKQAHGKQDDKADDANSANKVDRQAGKQQ